MASAQLDRFWQPRLGRSREGTSWEGVLAIVAIYRLLDSGSEWRLHRQWFVARLVHVCIPTAPGAEGAPYLRFQLDGQRLREVRRRKGNCLLRTKLSGRTPGELWEQYMRLVEVEEPFRNLNGDLSVRPIWHQTQARIEAHVFVSFLAYCLHVSLQARLRSLAPGLTPSSVLEKLSGLQMVDVRIPTTDGGSWSCRCTRGRRQSRYS